MPFTKVANSNPSVFVRNRGATPLFHKIPMQLWVGVWRVPNILFYIFCTGMSWSVILKHGFLVLSYQNGIHEYTSEILRL